MTRLTKVVWRSTKQFFALSAFDVLLLLISTLESFLQYAASLTKTTNNKQQQQRTRHTLVHTNMNVLFVEILEQIQWRLP